jgi:hypothetical protein
MSSDPIQDALRELAATSEYLRESGRLMRDAVSHLIETEEKIEKTNRYMQLVVEHVEKAINAALRAQDGGPR